MKGVTVVFLSCMLDPRLSIMHMRAILTWPKLDGDNY